MREAVDYIGAGRGGIMMSDGKGGNVVRDSLRQQGEVSCLPMEMPYQSRKAWPLPYAHQSGWYFIYHELCRSVLSGG